MIDPNLAGGHVLAGYKTVREVTSAEMDILKVNRRKVYRKVLHFIYYGI